MADQELTPQQRAATVIVALGTDKASRIYQYMGPDELEQLTLEVAKLGHVPDRTHGAGAGRILPDVPDQ